MARALRVEFPGAIYHVTVRMLGNWKTEETLLFEDDADRQRFLDRLGERVKQFNIRLYLFVLMTNHFHLVFATPEGNCSQFMQSLSTAYTVYFNLRHGRHGHLFDGRYHAKLVAGDGHLLALSRYVHLNPVQVGAMKSKPIPERIQWLRQYPWSSYPSYIGRRKALEFVHYGPLLAARSGQPRQQPKRYREFVETGLAEADDDFRAVLKASPRCIGDAPFRTWVDELHRQLIKTRRRPEDVSFRHVTEPLRSAAVLDILAEVFQVPVAEFRQRRRDSPLRGVAARFLCRYAGMTQRDVADLLQAGSGAAISHQQRRLGERLLKDRQLLRQVEKVQQRLNERRRETTPANKF